MAVVDVVAVVAVVDVVDVVNVVAFAGVKLFSVSLLLN